MSYLDAQPERVVNSDSTLLNVYYIAEVLQADDSLKERPGRQTIMQTRQDNRTVSLRILPRQHGYYSKTLENNLLDNAGV